MATFLESLHSGRVLLMDGAMGTELQRAGLAEGECYELWNLTHP
ncbi:MAG: methionine synthase, partial [Planctomycetota bacterium]